MAAGMISERAAISIADMLDNCVHVEAGQQVLIVAAVDGLYGGRNYVDEHAVNWIQHAVQARQANASVMWLNMPLHADVYWNRANDDIPRWELPPVFSKAIEGADLVIGQMLDLWTEGELKDSRPPNFLYNMATTAPLLASAWALTPWELVAEIRYQAAMNIKKGARWSIVHPNGTNVSGTIGTPMAHMFQRRRGPFPKGVFPSTPTNDAEGVLIFEHTGPNWARHIGLPTHFSEPVRITLEDGMIKDITGGEEAETLQTFLTSLSHHIGDGAFKMRGFHGGTHPHARVSEAECPDPMYRSFIEHHGAHSVHLHLADSHLGEDYPFNVHVSAEVNGATMTIGDNVVYENGRLTAFDHPEVQRIAAKYPDPPASVERGEHCPTHIAGSRKRDTAMTEAETKPQTVVIYHGECFDGFTAAWAFRQLNPTVQPEYVPGHFGEAPPDVTGKEVYILDFSYPRDTLVALKEQSCSLLVLDHHKTAEADLAGLDFCVFDMERSGCGITWDYFSKEPRPWLVNVMEDRDLWRHRYPETEPVMAYAAVLPMDFAHWDELAQDSGKAVEVGAAIRLYIDSYGEKSCANAFIKPIGGHDVPVTNISYQNASDHVHKLCLKHPEAPFAASFFLRADGMWQFSLRSIGEFDVSEIAKQYGGGGHRNAAGFQVPVLPWETQGQPAGPPPAP